MEVQAIEVLQIVALSSAVALATEAVMWLWAFRRDTFRTLRMSIDKQARKLEELRAAPHAPGAAGKAAKQKKVDKLDRAIKSQMAKELGSVKMKQALVMGVGLLLVFRLVSSWFGGHVVAKLPFEPFSLLAKLAHRGIIKPSANDCSVAFIYALCQAGVRPNISKLLDCGLSRKMVELSTAQAADWAQPANGKAH